MKSSSETLEQESMVGRCFGGRFNVLELLGQGGMGDVYLAEDQLLGNELIALKILHSDLGAEERHKKRFLRELQLTRQVTHPQIVRTFDLGEVDGRLYFSMELVRGTTLKKLLEDGPLSAEQSVPVIRQILSALDAIHAAGIVHRDLKPSNVLIMADGTVKVMDFGVARPAKSDLTAQHEVVGSALYMAPEQWVGGDLGPATDYYALGALWYELITGVTPFEGDSAATLMYLHLQRQPVPPIELVDTISGKVSNLITGLLAKDPAKRSLVIDQVRVLVDAALPETPSVAQEELDEFPSEEIEPPQLEFDDHEEPLSDRAVSWLEEHAFVPVRANRVLTPVLPNRKRRWHLGALASMRRLARPIGQAVVFVVAIAILLAAQSAWWEYWSGISASLAKPRSSMKTMLEVLGNIVTVVLIGATPCIAASLMLKPRKKWLSMGLSHAAVMFLAFAVLTLGFMAAKLSQLDSSTISTERGVLIHVSGAAKEATRLIAHAIIAQPALPEGRVMGSYALGMKPSLYLLLSLLAVVSLWGGALYWMRVQCNYFSRRGEFLATTGLLVSGLFSIQFITPFLAGVIPATMTLKSLSMRFNDVQITLPITAALCVLGWMIIFGLLLVAAEQRSNRTIVDRTGSI